MNILTGNKKPKHVISFGESSGIEALKRFGVCMVVIKKDDIKKDNKEVNLEVGDEVKIKAEDGATNFAKIISNIYAEFKDTYLVEIGKVSSVVIEVKQKDVQTVNNIDFSSGTAKAITRSNSRNSVYCCENGKVKTFWLKQKPKPTQIINQEIAK